MSFSITSALVLLMTLGQIFLEGGNFKSRYEPHEMGEAVTLLRKSCRMILADEDIAKMSPDALIMIVKEGIKRQETQINEGVETYCSEQAAKFNKLDPGTKAPACDRTEAIAAIQESLPAMVSPISQPLEIFSNFNMNDAVALYDYLCAQTPSDEVPANIDLEEVLSIYNKAMEEALSVDLNRFNQPVLSQSSLIYSNDGRSVIGEVFQNESRRSWVPLDKIPDVVRKAFISAEDKNFYSHGGVELRGVLRGFIRYVKDKTIVGGSTLTQQVVKNLVLTNDITLERKTKEMVIATRLEKMIPKDKILEIYLNLINLGRNSWGVQTAAENYFGEETFISNLGLNEASFFAGVTHSPNRYEPEFNFDRIKERQQFVLREMVENGFITEEDRSKVKPEEMKFVERKVLQSSYFHKAVEEDMKKRLSQADSEQGGLYLFSTQIPSVQVAMEKALQERLFQYELGSGRLKWESALGNMLPQSNTELTQKQWAEFLDPQNWSKKLVRFKNLYADVHWLVAVVLEKNQSGIQMGYLDPQGQAQMGPLYRGYESNWGRTALSELKVGDVVFVEPQKETLALRLPTEVQGAAVAMEAKTGKVLAVTGGFSFHGSELNRAIHSLRQPGSTVKPFTYLAALNMGIQPNEVLPNNPIYFNPIYLPGERQIRRFMKCNAWSVRNYSSGGAASMTMRRALETSSNRATAAVLKLIWPNDPELGLNLVREVFMDFGVYEDPNDCYPVILGADETNLLKLSAAYAAMANGGTVVEPHFLDEEKNAGLLQRPPQSKSILSVDPVSLFQTKNILAGAITRGTGKALSEYGGLVAGKTGTSSDYNDVWFMGFSNDVVVGVWVGYDNADKKRSLGDGATGGGLAAPIAKGIFDEVFKYYPPTDILSNPPEGINLQNNDGILESFRSGYAPPPSLVPNTDRNTNQWLNPDRANPDDYITGNGNSRNSNSGFYFEEDPVNRERERISPRAKRAIESGQSGGLY